MTRTIRHVAIAIVALLLPIAALAQQDSTVEWRLSLQDLGHRLPETGKNATGIDGWRADAEQLRSSLVSFATAHPEMHLDLPAPLPERPSVDALKPQLDKLTAAVDQVIGQSPSSPFHLGTITTVVSSPTTTPSLVTDRIEEAEIEQHNFPNIAKAFDYLPGVEIQHIANNRNEAGMMVRGFTTRGQVPFYMDGIPISVPYDGFVDFNRFLTGDLAELQVDKGYSSPLLGPNALGGTINLVTKEPAKQLEIEALAGIGSGNTQPYSLSVGSRWKHFFVQGSFDRLGVDNVRLSGNFPVNQYTNLPDIKMTDQLNNAATRDDRYTARVGWTPRGGDEYIVSYSTQNGQKGVPLYQGANTAAAFKNFWVWPYWDMDSYYFHSVTKVGSLNSVKFRAFYNKFDNAIDMFSNDTYTTMNTSNAEHSAYAEHNDGASTEFTTLALPRNVISGSFFFKGDTHTEIGTYPGRAPSPLITPTLVDRDQQISIGFQDAINLAPRLGVTLGLSADHFNGVQAQAYNAALTALAPFTCISSPANTSFDGCTLHAWNVNPQASISYQVSESGNLFVTFADRGRFPMLKDIYSSGLGSGLPNPELKPERSRNWNVGYSQRFAPRTFVQFDLFRSDLRNAIESAFITDPGGTTTATEYCPSSKINGFCSQMVNIGQEVHQGAEVKLRSTPIRRLTLDASYSYLKRTLTYDFASVPAASVVNTSIIILPTLPQNKLVGTATVTFPHDVIGLVSARYEGGLTLQDTSYATTSPLFQPFTESFATMDLGAVVPLYKRARAQVGVKNVFDKDYYYTAGYPEAGRSWFLNLRYQF